MARSAARIPTRDVPANGAEFLVFVGMTMSPTSASGTNFDSKVSSGICDWDLRLAHHTLRLLV